MKVLLVEIGACEEKRQDDLAQRVDRLGAVIAVRRCDPLSRPFVYREPKAQSLLIIQRS